MLWAARLLDYALEELNRDIFTASHRHKLQTLTHKKTRQGRTLPGCNGVTRCLKSAYIGGQEPAVPPPFVDGSSPLS